MKYVKESREKTVEIRGVYANYFQVGQNAFEFLLDFGQLYCQEENEEASIHSRVITSPAHAKMLLATLWEAIKRHEQIFGPIKDGLVSEEENED